MTSRSLLPDHEPVVLVTAETEHDHPHVSVVATEDPLLIQRWAQRRGAEPATGEATESGPGVVDVHDGDAGIRFNFPGVGRYRPITWDEWFGNFARHELVFVYEREAHGATPSGRYRLLKRSSLAMTAPIVTAVGGADPSRPA